MGMIINHNLSALNTFNKLSANNALMNKSLEKLSSGYRINTAADDAAGLAISEKMRGQIRGLDQAKSNSQDAISMTQTAEGALDETTSILQRMRELSVKASTDTLTDSNRTAVQDEIDALTSEINRIGNTTSFNTKKLLNGGGVEKDLTVHAVKGGAAAGEFKGASQIIQAAADATRTVALDGTNDLTITAATVNANNGSLGNFDVEVKAGGVADVVASFANGKLTIELGTTQTNNTASNIQTKIQALGNKDGIKFGSVTATTTATGANTLGNGGLSATGFVTVTDKMAGGQDLIVDADKAFTAPVSQLTGSTAAVAAKWSSGQITALGDNESATVKFNGVTVTIARKDGAAVAAAATDGRTATVTIDGTADAKKAIADGLKAAFEKAQAYGGSELKGLTFNATGATNAARFEILDTKLDGATNNSLKMDVTQLTGTTFALANNGLDATNAIAITNGSVKGVTEVRGKYTMEIDKAFEAAGMTLKIGGQTFTTVASGADASKGEINVGTDKHAQALELAKAINANSSLGAQFDATVDNAGKITLTEKATKATGTNAVAANNYVIGNKAVQGIYDFKVDNLVAAGGKYEIDGVKIEVTDNAADARIANGTAVLYNADKATQVQNLMQAIKSNSTLNTKYDTTSTDTYASSDTIQLKQRAGQESMVGTTALRGTNAKDAFSATFQIGANTGQTMGLTIQDMRAEALTMSSKTASSTVTVQDSDGNDVTASYKAASTVTDGTSDVNVEYSLDVSTSDKATAAISVIDKATSTVSAERSKMGAVINRLEHTINNLTTSSENLTSAESSIRDVDMASEMAKYTNKSVLNQAATAMLAKANQQPQQVLTLLQG